MMLSRKDCPSFVWSELLTPSNNDMAVAVVEGKVEASKHQI